MFAKYPRKQEKFTPVDQKGMFKKFIEEQDACLPVPAYVENIPQ